MAALCQSETVFALLNYQGDQKKQKKQKKNKLSPIYRVFPSYVRDTHRRITIGINSVALRSEYALLRYHPDKLYCHDLLGIPTVALRSGYKLLRCHLDTLHFHA